MVRRHYLMPVEMENEVIVKYLVEHGADIKKKKKR